MIKTVSKYISTQFFYSQIVAIFIGSFFYFFTEITARYWLLITAIIAVSYHFARTFSRLTVIAGLSCVISGIMITALTRVNVLIQLEFLVLLFVVIFGLCLFIISRAFDEINQTLIDVFMDLSLVAISLFLVVRWPFSTAENYLAFLSFEDNAAWISTVAGIARDDSGQYVEGVGGYVLDPLMALIYWIQSDGGLTASPTTIYSTTVVTYGLLQLFAIVTGAFFVRQISQEFKQDKWLTLIGALASIGMCYVALQLPRSTGHLTFIGALVVIWTALLFLAINSLPNNYSSVIILLLLIGILGMWWPFVLALGVLSSGFIITTRKKIRHLLSSVVDISRVKLLLLIVGGSSAAFVLLPIFRDSLTAMPIRNFITTSGGVQPVPGYLTVAGVLALVFVAQKFQKNSYLLLGYYLLASLGIVVVILYFSSIFTGPDFTPKYTYLKTLLLFSISTLPFVAVAICIGMKVINGINAVPAIILSFFVIGNVTTGWDVNSPKETVSPIWSSRLITESEINPDALILCHNSNVDRNFDAYQCSRHAVALQAKDDLIAGPWRLFQLNSSSALQDQFLRLQQNFNEFLDNGGEIILITMEDEFNISDDDRWWMDQLPLNALKIVSI